MRLSFVHAVNLALASWAALLSIAPGSAVTALAAGGGALAVAIGVGLRSRGEASLAFRLVVHGATVVGLAAAALVWTSARFDAGLVVAVLGLSNRQLLHAGLRDDGIILGLAAVLLAAGTMVTPSVLFVFIFATFVVTASWAAYAGTILSLVERRSAERPRWERQRLGGKGKMAFGLLVSTLFAFTIFSAFPRFNFASWLAVGAFFDMSGAAEQMELDNGSISSASLGRVAVRIRLQTAQKVDTGGLYVRLFSLDDLTGSRFTGNWRRSDGPAVRLSREALGQPSRTVRVEFERLVPRAQLHPMVAIGRSGPVLPQASGLRSSVSGTWVGYTRLGQTILHMDHDLANRAPSPKPSDRALRRALRLPDTTDKRFFDLASRITSTASTSRERINAALQHFSSGYRYSLEAREGASADPIARFTFEAKQGHCEMYAASLVVLLRALEVPARVATGYHGGRWNEGGEYLEMGAEHAHAWVEVWDKDVSRWDWVDATPEDARPSSSRQAWSALTDLWDRVEVFWYEYVIDYDENKRRQVFGRLADWNHGFSSESSGPGSSEASRAGGTSFAWVVWTAPLFGLLGAGLWWWRRRDLGRRIVKALGQDPDRGLPLEQHLQRVPGSLRPLAEEAVSLYQSWRFGGSGQRAVVRDKVRALERACHRL